MKTLSRPFDKVMSSYDFEYNERTKAFAGDDNELKVVCDEIRHKYLLRAIELVETREDCKNILKKLMERNIDIREKVLEKMNLLTE